MKTPWNDSALIDAFDADFSALVEFASASACPAGFGYLDADGAITESKGVELWITCRMTYVFALAEMRGVQGVSALVEHGLDALSTSLHDDEYGGWFSALDATGEQARPVEPIRKEAYAHAFVILATSASYLAGHERGRALLDEALADQDAHWWEPSYGRVANSWNRDWSECEEYRGLNANMHTVEAYLAAFDATGERRWLDRAREIMRFVADLGARFGWRLPEHFDKNWVVCPEMFIENPADPFRPYGATPGHGFEWARLILHGRASLIACGDTPGEWMYDVAHCLVDRADTDGWDSEKGGIVYTTDFDGKTVVDTRMHWVVCEAVNATLALGKVSEELGNDDDVMVQSERFARYVAWADQVIHAGPGRWIHEVDADGHESETVWAGKADAYHVGQMLLLPRIGLYPGFAATLAQLRAQDHSEL